MGFKTPSGAGYGGNKHIGNAGEILTTIDNVQLSSGYPESIGDLPTLSNYQTGDIQASCITVQPPTPEAYFGAGGTAIGESRIFVGNHTYNSGVGCVHMFNFDGDYLGRIDAPETSTSGDTGFGWGIYCVDGLLIVNSNDYDNDPNAYDNGGDLDVGRTYVYDQMGNLLRTLPIPSTLYTSSDSFGMAAAAGCGRIVVGRQRGSGNYRFTPPDGDPGYPGDPGTGSFQGNATIYDYNGNIICPNLLWKNEMEYYSTTSSNSFGNPDPMVYDYDRPYYSASFGGRTYGGTNTAQQAIGYGKIVVSAMDTSVQYSPNQAASQANMGHVYMFDLNGNFEKILYHPWQTNFSTSLQTSLKIGEDIKIGSGRIMISAYRVDNPSSRSIGARYIYDMDGNYQFSILGCQDSPTGSDFNQPYQNYGCGIYGGIIASRAFYNAGTVSSAPNSTDDFAPTELYDINGRFIDVVYQEDMLGNTNATDDTAGTSFSTGFGYASSKISLGYGLLVLSNNWNTTGACINIFKIPTTYDGLIERSTGVTQN